MLPLEEGAPLSSNEKVKLGLNLLMEERVVCAGTLSADHVVKAGGLKFLRADDSFPAEANP